MEAILSGTVTVAGCGAVTACGAGLAPLEAALRGNLSALRARGELAGRGYQSTVCGWVPEEVAATLRAGAPSPQNGRAFLLAHGALRQTAVEGAALLDGAAPDRRGLVLATTKADVEALERMVSGRPCPPAWQRHSRPGWLAADLAAALDVRGVVQCVSVACVSGLVAIQQAAALLRRGEVDLVYVVGVDLVSHFVLAGFTSLKSLEPDGCRPFDLRRVGLSLGEGAGALLLTRSQRGVPSQGQVTGWGTSNDANHLTGPSRDGAGLALAARRALERAGAGPASVDYVNAHGTGTPYNDAMESHALRAVFGGEVPPFSSSKGLLGHTLGAAGILETILCLIALRAGLLPGTPRWREADPVVPQALVTEPRAAGRLARILKINCGFGGANAALVLEKSSV
jgi:3-oxoacyl-(acyl-carrier-protein) synthase